MRLFSILVALIAVTVCDGVERTFQVTFRVVDDVGHPVTGAQAGVSWENAKATKPSERIKSDEGLTDQDGKITLSGKTFTSGISYGVNKENYYTAWGLRYHFSDTRLLRWQPWNPTIEVVLKRKKNPVPMYAKRVLAEIPVSGADIGYDLIIGDWIHPHGKGLVSDMLFHSVAEVKNDSHYRGELVVTFPRPGDGLIVIDLPERQPSPLRMPYEAPSDGYEPKRTWRSGRKYNPQEMKNEEYYDDSSNTQNYFIRVRTELDANGNIVKAMYGKIHAPFSYGPRGFDRNGATGKQSIQFVYYLNPDGTRNIEYDPKRNLLKSAKRDDSDYENLAP